MGRPTAAFSAPGKVLLAGGYLVLDRNHTGLVFGLDARIHVHIETLSTSPERSLSEIIVRSPQFREAEWRYGFRETEGDGGIEVTQLNGHLALSQSRNQFVESALACALTYASAVDQSKIGPASITIVADTDYYSHTRSSNSNYEIPTADRFLDFNVPLDQAHKTGLGSSAALVTALTTAVVAHYAPRAFSDAASKEILVKLHNLAQASHSAAQKKVGSGFDVAAAVFGSCIYKRFSPSLLEGLGEVGAKGYSTRLKQLVEDLDESKKWDMEFEKSLAHLPRGLRLVMCDVDCGSETVSMVKSVLSWRMEKPGESLPLWETLQKGNEDLATELRSLTLRPARQSADYDNLRAIILTIRSLIREMSVKSGVPIEPETQTKLIDACCRLPGVVGGVVPGAGGFDAVALLVEDEDSIFVGLRDFLEQYRVSAEESQGVNVRKVRKVRLLGVKQEDAGVKAENLDNYQSWLR